MACASALTELVKGQTLTAARQVSGEDVARKVGGLPQASTHASHLAVDALAQLLRDL